MVPAAHRRAALNALVASIEAARYRVTSGQTGFTFVIPALANNGRADVLMRILKQRREGGYLYQIDRGATALTEGWDAFPRSSQNQPMFGHVERWFWEGLAGINTDDRGPGFRRFVIRRQMPEGIDPVSATYRSAQGLIASRWERRGGQLVMHVSVPVNTTATIHLPTRDAGAVTEHGVPLRRARGVAAVRPAGDGLAVAVGSGHYEMVMR